MRRIIKGERFPYYTRSNKSQKKKKYSSLRLPRSYINITRGSVHRSLFSILAFRLSARFIQKQEDLMLYLFFFSASHTLSIYQLVNNSREKLLEKMNEIGQIMQNNSQFFCINNKHQSELGANTHCFIPINPYQSQPSKRHAIIFSVFSLSREIESLRV